MALRPVVPSETNEGRRRVGPAVHDRFIPRRRHDTSAFHMSADGCTLNASPAKEEYKRLLAKELCGSPISRVLAFGPSTTASEEPELCIHRQHRHLPSPHARWVPQLPERILDAPDLVDDYYLNLLDWSDHNVVGVALRDSVYMWNATTGSITQLMQIVGTTISSIAWAPGGTNVMAIGTSDHQVQIWDTAKCRLIRCMPGHCARVGVLSWNGGSLLSSGIRDASIIHHDMRTPQRSVGRLEGHTHEVCGLKWAPGGVQLASGGNDNLLNVWDERRQPVVTPAGTRHRPLYTMRHHKAAVKALAWCPWQKHVLASGGGTADRMIRFWSMKTGGCTMGVDSHSQVCSLIWSVRQHELVSSHGFSHNQLIVWKYPSMTKTAELTGHTHRVLHMAASPDGTTVVSAGADETLRFWKLFGGDSAYGRHRDSLLTTGSAWTGSCVVR